MRNKFDQELENLHGDLVQMGHFIETTIDKMMSAFTADNYELAREVYENDDIADDLELQIERRSLRILLSQQPVARDLRTISTALKMITDMERICDLARNISRTVLRFEGQELIRKPENVLLMSEKCVIMVNKCVQAFINNNLNLAKEVIALDDEVDALYKNVHDNIAPLVAQNLRTVDQAVDLVMIAKHFERIGDHTVNIAEWVEFNITGEHKSHKLL
ncbi:MAG: phosphate signaling complex protein PhoU [Chitinispirillales bacterium]|jgi:phosphate transport system protein|nr:phosphate signaling complex protein PhoU [Chitinispirillales bacterium]